MTARWLYSQRSGELSRDGVHIAFCYSGFGPAKNEPSAQELPDQGPIPRGLWTFGALSTSTLHGPVARHLIAAKGTDTFGRDGFLMHGDSVARPGEASHGCIIASRPARELARDGDEIMVVE